MPALYVMKGTKSKSKENSITHHFQEIQMIPIFIYYMLNCFIGSSQSATIKNSILFHKHIKFMNKCLSGYHRDWAAMSS